MNEIKKNLDYLLELQTISLATINYENMPCISYAPYIIKDGKLYLLLSTVAEHFENIINQQFLCGLLIESDTAAQNLFLKKRLDIKLKYLEHFKTHPIISDFVSSYGEFVNTLIKMDFYFFELEIVSAKIVYGAGKAFELDCKFNLINQITGIHSDLPNFKYKGKVYYLVPDDLCDEFCTKYRDDYHIEIVTSPSRVEHIFDHFVNDFGYKNNLDGQKILVLT